MHFLTLNTVFFKNKNSLDVEKYTVYIGLHLQPDGNLTTYNTSLNLRTLTQDFAVL
jgi:hypothetical protein